MTTALPYPRLPNTAKGTPEPPDPIAAGVTLTAQELADETSTDLARAERVLPVASQVVVDYASDAPTAILNEAVIRFAGYLLGSDYGGVRSESLGPMSIDYITNHAAMFRNSGAMALLTRYKRRRAGAIG